VIDLVVRGDEADIAVDDGTVVAIGPGLGEPAREEIDAGGLLVLPGGVDAHVHFNEPGRSDWEGWATGTAALAAGGMTACIEMPLNASPPTVDGAAFDAKVAAASRAAVVDFALWGGLVPGDLARLDELAERGVVGFKAFMCDSGIEDFPAADDDVLGAGMERAAALGLPVAVHAERPSALRAPRDGTWREWAASRPPEAELEAIARALELAEETGCSLHVVHVSTAEGVAAVAEARARGVDATCETCPHYLVLRDADMDALGTLAKCAPPLRPDPEPLWAELERIDLVASDHSPCPPAMKAGGFDEAWGGIAGTQSTLPLLLGEGVRRGLDPAALARLVTAAPARRFGLAKGTLEVGADADIALVELGGPFGLGELRDRHRANPFAGRRLGARVVRTLLRGRPPGQGRLLVPDKRGSA
jgi:allantoinase